MAKVQRGPSEKRGGRGGGMARNDIHERRRRDIRGCCGAGREGSEVVWGITYIRLQAAAVEGGQESGRTP